MVDEREAWRAVGGDLEPEGPALRFLAHTPAPTGRALVRSGPVDPSVINRVRLMACGPGNVRVSVAVLRGGATLSRSTIGIVAAGDVPRPVIVELPRVDDDRGAGDRLRIDLAGDVGRIDLASVELLDTPAATLVPDPLAGPVLVTVDGEARRGVGLVTGQTLEAALAGSGAELGLSLARPVAARGGGPASVVLELLEGDEPRLSRRLPLGGGATGRSGWQEITVPLDGPARRGLTVRLALEAAVPTAVVVAEARRRAPGPDRPPRVLLVTSDTHRGDHLGAADRGGTVSTPVLDGLASEGVLFSDCFATTNFTNPSHVALMTGEHPRDTGILTNHEALAGEAVTLAERFAAAGWSTWAVVSARHLGHDVAGLGQGFDRISWPREHERSAERSLDVLRRWLAADGGGPLFCWLHLFDAHMPLDPPPEFERLYADEADLPVPRDPELAWLGEDIDLGPARARYKAAVSYLDDQLGQVLDHPGFEGAIVAVVGDHGESLGQHNIAFNHAGLYPDTLHVPLVMRWPGGPAGRIVSRPVRQNDLGRTLLELAGVPADGFPGSSLTEVAEAGDEVARYAMAAHGGMASLTLGGLHLILHLVAGHDRWERHETELYDLTVDPACQNDLVASRPDVAARLRGRLVAWLAAAGGTDRVARRVDDPATLAQLEALGYVASERPAGPLWEPDDCGWCRRLAR